MNLLINTGHFTKQVNGEKHTEVRLLELDSHYEAKASVYRQFELTQKLANDVLLKSTIAQRLIDLSNKVKSIVKLIEVDGVDYESLPHDKRVLYLQRDYFVLSDDGTLDKCTCDVGHYFAQLRAQGVIQSVDLFNCVHKREVLTIVKF